MYIPFSGAPAISDTAVRFGFVAVGERFFWTPARGINLTTSAINGFAGMGNYTDYSQ
jgi:hypothetical protein